MATNPEQNQQTSLQGLKEIAKLAKGDSSFFDEHLSKKVIWRDPAQPDLKPGLEGAKDYLRTFAEAFPDIRFNAEDCFAAGDKVAYRWTVEGTNTGPYPGMAPTGKKIKIQGMTIDTYDADGKLVSSNNVWDTLGFAQQLGIAGPQAETAARPPAAEERPTAQ